MMAFLAVQALIDELAANRPPVVVYNTASGPKYGA